MLTFLYLHRRPAQTPQNGSFPCENRLRRLHKGTLRNRECSSRGKVVPALVVCSEHMVKPVIEAIKTKKCIVPCRSMLTAQPLD